MSIIFLFKQRGIYKKIVNLDEYVYLIMLMLGRSNIVGVFYCVGWNIRPADHGLVLRQLLTNAHLPDRVCGHCMDLW